MKNNEVFIKNFTLLSDMKENDMTTVKNLAVAKHQPILHNFTYLIAIEVPTGNLTYCIKCPNTLFIMEFW